FVFSLNLKLVSSHVNKKISDGWFTDSYKTKTEEAFPSRMFDEFNLHGRRRPRGRRRIYCSRRVWRRLHRICPHEVLYRSRDGWDLAGFSPDPSALARIGRWTSLHTATQGRPHPLFRQGDRGLRCEADIRQHGCGRCRGSRAQWLTAVAKTSQSA